MKLRTIKRTKHRDARRHARRLHLRKVYQRQLLEMNMNSYFGNPWSGFGAFYVNPV